MRVLAAAAVLVLGLAAYALLLAGLAGLLLPVHWLVDTLFYALAGIAWIPAAARLTRWAQRRAPPRHSQRQRPRGTGPHLQ
jgi:hypothetical protein